MKNSIILFFAVALISQSCKQSDPEEKVLQLVWSDEFDGTELDLNKWEIQEGNGQQYGLWNWGNEEEQWYQEENVSVENGKLVIKAVAEEYQLNNNTIYEYTSARLRSLNSADFKYGRFEASISMDAAPGLWHAFWMLPSEAEEPWPISGEIDIMEFVGNRPNEIFNTIHFADAFGNRNQIGELWPYNPAVGYHVHAVEWDENSISWLLDGEEIFRVLRTNSQISSTWPFDAKFHMLLNTAVGGNLGGLVDDNQLASPKYMRVEYVRVYQEI